MKRFITLILIGILMLAGCASPGNAADDNGSEAADNNVAVETPAFDETGEEEAASGKSEQINEAGGAEKTDQEEPVEAGYADMDAQLQLIAESSDLWYADSEYEEWWYAVTDLDRDSSLEMMMAAQKTGVGSFASSSMGRLFDAVSALLGICSYNTYEGECAINLEKCAHSFIERKGSDHPEFEFKLSVEDGELIFDQLSLFKDIYLCYNTRAVDVSFIAYGFHKAVVNMIVKAFGKLREETGLSEVCLSGGVFNNRIILSETVAGLKDLGYKVYWNKKVPLGDGGISLGQAYYAMLKESRK